MPNLVSPGVSVTLENQSFFIPANGVLTPIFFIATADEKLQTDGVTQAAGTFEHDVIRTVTSVRQSLELFGVPSFLEDGSGNPHHGDARNEYGLFALNQFLGLGARAFVVRADVNLNDSLDDIRDMWDTKVQETAFLLENLVNTFIVEFNDAAGYIPSTPGTAGSQIADFNGTLIGVDPSPLAAGVYDFSIAVDGGLPSVVSVTVVGGETYDQLIVLINAQISGPGATATLINGNITFVSNTTGPLSNILVADGVSPTPMFVGLTPPFVSLLGADVGTSSPFKETVTVSEYVSLAEEAATDLFSSFSFTDLHDPFFDDSTLSPLDVFALGYAVAPTTTYNGLQGIMADFVAGLMGSVVPDEFTAAETSNLFIGAADDFKYTVEFRNLTSLGANDSARRIAIVQALQASINSNQEIRSENFEYNIVTCPGYHETADEMLSLVADIGEEAFVVADTPMDMDATQVVAWAGTTERQTSTNIAYYYPHSLASNIDGRNVLASASGTALRTITFSDSVSELWFAPAGTTRGLVTGVTDVGYASGTLGGATVFAETHLNQGQRDDLYKYFTNINPITFFPSRGIIVWGQKTSAPDASALDRVNVVRLLMFIRRQLRKNTMSFVFEPNDQLTRDNLKAAVDGLLGDLVVRRGLYDFASISDESNNTPDRIDRNEMYIDIAIKPVKAAEFIYIPIRVVSTGTAI